ncbi:hypothetical protein KC343_g11839 [Hortaea werneckii]|nr:hypothetical protein KC323_g8602 [Hortaea werneckii]KAI7253327.1 hypothetical protein KC352_g12124 [Hortaea werneckii]KAI7345102.1 hypothetical protein KC320_g8501 [Hortaea werneckii]KAI7568455.1 hypothetical protein KC317_g4174 [Hortaea werneckii]KAI7600410.1 hypothetical protein KC346_g13274 [Hortaea werneckii]
MGEIAELSESDRTFLESYLPHSASLEQNHPELPFVTVTYAQSMDSMISLTPGLRTTLSGPETKSMTHYLRLQHDAILVGVGTAIPDDPGLNSRYPGAKMDSQPRPIVIDPRRRWDVEPSKVLTIARQGQGKGPWIYTLPDHCSNPDHELERAGGKRFSFSPKAQQPSGQSGPCFSWIELLKHLKAQGINSLMIEGGASIISTFLSTPELVQSVIVTIAPTWLGNGGVMVSPDQRKKEGVKVNAARLGQTMWRQFGADAVLCGRLQ